MDSTTLLAPATTTTLNPRQSPMNRTMIVSKKSSKRPGLPEVSPMEQNTKNLGTPKAEICDELAQILAQNLVPEGVASEILKAVKMRENQWKEMAEKAEKERLLCEIKLQTANRTCEKAAQLFRICEQSQIDLNAILAQQPDAIERLQFRQLVSGLGSARSPLGTPNSENGSELARLTRERDALGTEVHSLEENYSNLFKLYEKMRMNCANLKETEQSLRDDLAELGTKYDALHRMYTELLWEAKKKLDGAQAELRRSERAQEEKTLGIRLALKRARIQIGALENALKSKAQENQELHAICDQLIAARDDVMMAKMAAMEAEEDDGDEGNSE